MVLPFLTKNWHDHIGSSIATTLSKPNNHSNISVFHRECTDLGTDSELVLIGHRSCCNPSYRLFHLMKPQHTVTGGTKQWSHYVAGYYVTCRGYMVHTNAVHNSYFTPCMQLSSHQRLHSAGWIDNTMQCTQSPQQLSSEHKPHAEQLVLSCGRSASCSGFSNLYSLLSTHELQRQQLTALVSCLPWQN